MSDLSVSLAKLANLNIAEEPLLKEFIKDIGKLVPKEYNDVAALVKNAKTASDEWMMKTIIQCRALLDLTDKSKPDAYKEKGIRLIYACRERIDGYVYYILLLEKDKPLLYKRLFLLPSTYKIDKKVDQQNRKDKDFNAAMKTFEVGMAGGTVAMAGSALAGVAGGAAAVGTAGASGALATAGGAMMAAVGHTAAGTAGAAFVSAFGGSAGVAGVIASAPVSVPVLIGVGAIVGAGCVVKNHCTFKSKCFRYTKDIKSVVSYMVMKPGEMKTIKTPVLSGSQSVVCICQDFWNEPIDLYLMYPIPTKQLTEDPFIGMFATTGTGWPTDAEALKKVLTKYDKLVKTII